MRSMYDWIRDNRVEWFHKPYIGQLWMYSLLLNWSKRKKKWTFSCRCFFLKVHCASSFRSFRWRKETPLSSSFASPNRATGHRQSDESWECDLIFTSFPLRFSKHVVQCTGKWIYRICNASRSHAKWYVGAGDTEAIKKHKKNDSFQFYLANLLFSSWTPLLRCIDAVHCLCILRRTCGMATNTLNLCFRFHDRDIFEMDGQKLAVLSFIYCFSLFLNSAVILSRLDFYLKPNTPTQSTSNQATTSLFFCVKLSSFFWCSVAQILEILINSIIFTSCIAMRIRFSATEDKKGSVFCGMWTQIGEIDGGFSYA